MPTIKQLPLAATVSATDELPLSQGGFTRSVRASVLLGGTQAAITLAQNKLLGRVSTSPGGPEPIGVGAGLGVQAGVLAATGADHAAFQPAAGLSTGDEVVINSGGAPKRIAATGLRGLFSAGAGVTIQGGVISAPNAGATGPAGPKGDTGAGAVVGTAAGTVAAGDDPRIVGATRREANLGDLPSVAAARVNLGLAPVAATGAYADLRGRPTLPTDNSELGNGRGFVNTQGAAAAAAGVITVNGAPNAGGALGTHMDIYNPGTTAPTEIVYGTRITYTNTAPGQTTYDFCHAVQAVWQVAPGVPGGQMFGLWTIAEGPKDNTSTWGIVGYEINVVNRGDDTGWTYSRGLLPRFSAGLQLAPEGNTFTHGGTAQNVTAALVIGQSPTPGAGGIPVRNHSGVLIEPNAITGRVGRAFTVTGDITSATPADSTPWGLMTVLGAWLHGIDTKDATIFDNLALRMPSNHRLGWANVPGTQTAYVGSNEAGEILLVPASGQAVRVGGQAVWHAGSLRFGAGLTLSAGVLSASGGAGPAVGTTAGTVAAGDDARIVGAAARAANLSDLGSPMLARANVNRGLLVLAGGTSIATDAAAGNAFTVLLGVNATLQNPSNLAAGASYVWTLRQDSAGGRTLAFGAAFRWSGGTAPTLSTTPGAVDVLSAVSDGTSLFAVLSKGFA